MDGPAVRCGDCGEWMEYGSAGIVKSRARVENDEGMYQRYKHNHFRGAE